MIISKEKMEKIKGINNDDSDLFLKINEYLTHKHEYIENEMVFENIEALQEKLYQKEPELSTLYVVFSKNKEDFGELDVLRIEDNVGENSLNTSDMFYSGKKYELKLEKYQKRVEILLEESLKNTQEVALIVDISSVSSYPLWDTIMRRKMNSTVSKLENIALEDISKETLERIIRSSKPQEVSFEDKFDLDFLILCMKKIIKKANITTYFIDSIKTNESIFLINELIKFTRALNMDKNERYEYIYDTVCKDMDEMFSKYGFCNFKENKCVAQRHKTLFHRYPVPKTDGCCFKVVRKCEHNNKDGTCKVKCLPCKLFTCPYLGKLHIGIRASELLLMRAFLNNKQKRVSIYKFYNSKEFLLERIKKEE